MTEGLKNIKVGENVSLYRVAKIVYDKDESIQDKLTTVYATVFSLRNCGLVMLVNGHKEYVDLFLGVVSRNLITHMDDESIKVSVIEKELTDNGKALRCV